MASHFGRINGVQVFEPTQGDTPTIYGIADRWTVDDQGYLHLLCKGDNKTHTVATYAPGAWELVRYSYASR